MLKDVPSIQHCANGMLLNYFWSGENLGIQDFVCSPSLYFEGELSWPATSRTFCHTVHFYFCLADFLSISTCKLVLMVMVTG